MRNSFKRLLVVLLSAIVLCVSVSAYEVIDLTKKGSINVAVKDPDSKKMIGGGTVALYKVGDIRVKNGYSFVLTEAYQNSHISLEDLEASGLAQKLKDYTEMNDIKGQSMSIDENGKAIFSNLPLGLYLLVQTDAAKGYYEFSPFLVSVPINEENGYVYDVDAQPKMENIKPIPEKPTDSKLPSTGQLNWPIPLFTVTGMVLLIMGFILYNTKKEKSHEA